MLGAGNHKVGTSLLPHLGRQITSHSGISSAEYIVLVAVSGLTVPNVNLNRLARGLGWEISRMSHQVNRIVVYFVPTLTASAHQSWNVHLCTHRRFIYSISHWKEVTRICFQSSPHWSDFWGYLNCCPIFSIRGLKDFTWFGLYACSFWSGLVRRNQAFN